MSGITKDQAKWIMSTALELETSGRIASLTEGAERKGYVARNRELQCALSDYLASLTIDLASPQPKAEPVQCLDCGSNNLGVPANYDSVVDSVKTKVQDAEFMSEVAYEHVFKDGSKSLSYALSFAGFPPRNDADHVNLLYAAAPQAKPLTDEQISRIWDGHVIPVFGKNGINPIVFARAIEAAHGIGGGK